MSHLAVDVEALARAINDLGRCFHTKDVSEHASVRDAHPVLSTHSHYHAFIGKALMDHHYRLGIRHTGAGTARGAAWTRRQWRSSSRLPP